MNYKEALKKNSNNKRHLRELTAGASQCDLIMNGLLSSICG